MKTLRRPICELRAAIILFIQMVNQQKDLPPGDYNQRHHYSWD
jgi:hypothetical protein